MKFLKAKEAAATVKNTPISTEKDSKGKETKSFGVPIWGKEEPEPPEPPELLKPPEPPEEGNLQLKFNAACESPTREDSLTKSGWVSHGQPEKKKFSQAIYRFMRECRAKIAARAPNHFFSSGETLFTTFSVINCCGV